MTAVALPTLPSHVPTLILVRGIPGSGKSTLARGLATHLRMPHVEADEAFETPDGYLFDRARLDAAHADCLMRTAAHLWAGQSTIVANTFIRRWEVEPYLALAAASPALVRIVRLDCPLDVALARGVHQVPPEFVAAAHARLQPLSEWGEVVLDSREPVDPARVARLLGAA